MAPRTTDTVPEDAPEHCPVRYNPLEPLQLEFIAFTQRLIFSVSREQKAIRLVKPMPALDVQTRTFVPQHPRDPIPIFHTSPNACPLLSINF
jgi:hypothetical protein